MYVDDIVITIRDQVDILHLKHFSHKFYIKEVLGNL